MICMRKCWNSKKVQTMIIIARTKLLANLQLSYEANPTTIQPQSKHWGMASYLAMTGVEWGSLRFTRNDDH